MHRLFVALRPPATLRTRLIALMGGVPGARWQNDEQLHLTLRFIGEVDRHQAEDIAATLGAVHAAPAMIAIEGVGAFDHGGVVHSLWAGVAADATLTHLHQAVERALVRAGVAPERRAFRPHITLARLGRSGGATGPWLAGYAGLQLAPVRVDHFGLFESHLGREGASYSAVARYPLASRLPG